MTKNTKISFKIFSFHVSDVPFHRIKDEWFMDIQTVIMFSSLHSDQWRKYWYCWPGIFFKVRQIHRSRKLFVKTSLLLNWEFSPCESHSFPCGADNSSEEFLIIWLSKPYVKQGISSKMIWMIIANKRLSSSWSLLRWKFSLWSKGK